VGIELGSRSKGYGFAFKILDDVKATPGSYPILVLLLRRERKNKVATKNRSLLLKLDKSMSRKNSAHNITDLVSI